MKHLRTCWECGNVAEHLDNIAPEVCCKICGSQDTRDFQRQGPRALKEVFDTLPPNPVAGCDCAVTAMADGQWSVEILDKNYRELMGYVKIPRGFEISEKSKELADYIAACLRRK